MATEWALADGHSLGTRKGARSWARVNVRVLPDWHGHLGVYKAAHGKGAGQISTGKVGHGNRHMARAHRK